MVNNADKVLLLADHSKIGKVSRVSYCPIKSIDFLITDKTIEDPLILDAMKKNAVLITSE